MKNTMTKTNREEQLKEETEHGSSVMQLQLEVLHHPASVDADPSKSLRLELRRRATSDPRNFAVA